MQGSSTFICASCCAARIAVTSLVSVAKVKIVLWNRPFWHFSAASFACHFGVAYDTHVG